MRNQEIIEINISELHLWTENPRDPIETDCTDFEIISRALDENPSKWNLQKLVDEMGDTYDLSELPTVVKIKNKYVVYDGNRRIAILKYVQNKSHFKGLLKGLRFKNKNVPIDFINRKKLPCNLCNIETALKNVERKHTNSGDWGRLERDYFILKHLQKEKSHFIKFEEQTGVISKNPKMNKRFVKDEILTIENLEEVGFHYEPSTGFVTNYSNELNDEIINGIVSLVENGIITTRKNRKELKKPLLDTFPQLKDKIKVFSNSKNSFPLSYSPSDEKESNKKNRRTRKTKESNILFGKTLLLQSGKVNDLYLAIDKIYEKNEKDISVLPIIGISLRLIIEVAARVYYSKKGEKLSENDQLYKSFLKQAKKDMSLNKEVENFVSLTNSWLNNKNNLDAILGKYAHGNIITIKSDLLEHSKIIGDILQFYFKR